MSHFGSWFGGNSGDQDQQQRPRTRSQTASNLSDPAANTSNRKGRGRRSPSPSPTPLPVGEAHNANSAILFQFDSTNLSQRALQNAPPQLQQEDFEDAQEDSAAATMASLQDAQIQAMVQAATQAALAALQATGSHKKKPDLPAFDPNNIEVWIKRVESAFVRANISLPSDKFAFLESKFPIDQDAKVNEFLYGEMTENRWHDFLTYLRNRYGKSVKHQCTLMMRGFQRDGRRPSDMLAYIRQETSKVTLDDLRKEMVFSSLPQEVQRTMADRVAGMTAEQMATLADRFFDKDGKPLHPSSGSAISTVQSSEGAEEEEETDVSAIRGGKPSFKKQQFRRPPPRQKFTPAFSNPPSASGSAAASPPAPGGKSNATAKPTCRHHVKYGEKSFSCEVGCHLYPGKAKQGNGQAGARL